MLIDQPQKPELELGTESLINSLKIKKHLLHGNSSTSDCMSIREEGLIITEGRAMFSINLIHALDWATSREKRENFSKSLDKTTDKDIGSAFILNKKEELSLGFGNFTDYSIDHVEKEIRGQPLKWASAYKQLGLFRSSEVSLRRSELESMESSDREQITINQNKIILELNPYQGLLEKVQSIFSKTQDMCLERVENITQKLIEVFMIDPSKDNFQIIEELVESTIESIVISRIRNKSLAVMTAKGYLIFNYAKQPIRRFGSNLQTLEGQFEKWESNLLSHTERKGDWIYDYAENNTSNLKLLLSSNHL